MSQTLILVFHPDLTRSTANAALMEAAWQVESVEMVDMAAIRPEAGFDMFGSGADEAKRLLAADRIVLQFPMQWYSVPGLLKDWIDAVLTRMYYVVAEEGARLAGTPLMIAVTAGADPAMFARDGQAGFTAEEMLVPLRALARRCGLLWHPHFILHGANHLTAGQIAEAGTAYQAALRAFIARTPVKLLAAA